MLFYTYYDSYDLTQYFEISVQKRRLFCQTTNHIFNLTFNHIFNIQPSSVHIMAVEILNLKSQGDFTSDKKRQLRPSEEYAA